MSAETEDDVLEIAEDNKIVSVDVDAVAPKKTSHKAGYIVLFLLALLIAGAFLYGYARVVALEQDLATVGAMEARVLANVENRIQGSAVLTTLEKRLDELATRQEMLANAVDQPVARQLQMNEDYALAEVEYLLIIANYNLQFNRDVTTALAAMDTADSRLRGLHDPMVMRIRSQLIADINDLRSLPQVNLSGLGLFLSDFINRVDALPLKKEVVDTTVMTTETMDEALTNDSLQAQVKHFFVLVWQEIRTLFYYRNDENVNVALLLPEEVYFLRANLKLELANARFAVFNRDTDNLQASIDHIETWLHDYFDLSDASVQNIYDSLVKMKDLELNFPVLDISSSLESVRALIRSQEEHNNVPK